MALTGKEIYPIMVGAGFPHEIAVTMTAIALRESAGDPNAFNGNAATGDRSYGLLQINMKDPNVAAALVKAFPQLGTDEKALLDPNLNAKAAHLLWGGRNSNLALAWYINRVGPYKDRYEMHLPEAQAAALGI